MRWYEAKGLLEAVARGEGGQRAYSDEQVRLLCEIVRWRSDGMRLRRIHALPEARRGRSIEALARELIDSAREARQNARTLEELAQEASDRLRHRTARTR